MKRNILPVVALLSLCLLLSGCPGGLEVPETPILLLDIQDFDRNPGVAFVTAVSIDKTAPETETVTIANRLDLFSSDDSGMQAGYTFALEEGATYSTVRYTHGTTIVSVPVHIDSAEAGKTYVVGLFY